MGVRAVLISAVLIVVLLAAGSGLGGWLFKEKPEPPKREAGPPPPLVQTVTITPESVRERFTAYGTVRAERVCTIAAEVAASVIEIPGRIRAGSVVTAGQPVVRLDERRYCHELANAQALAESDLAQLDELDAVAANISRLIKIAEREFRIASDERDRLARLFETDLAHKREYDLAKMSYEQAHRVLQNYQNEASLIAPRRQQFEASHRARLAAAQLAQLNIERCTMRAPFAGALERMYVERGDYVTFGTPVVGLVDASRVEVPIQLPTAVYDQVRVGTSCVLSCESKVGVSWPGTVTRLAPSADPQTRTFAAYVIVDNNTASEPLLPGAFVRATVEGPLYENALFVPRSAIRDDKVLVVNGLVAAARAVRTERFLEDRALVTGDLRPGAQVILAPLDVLADGTPIRVPTDTERPATSAPTAEPIPSVPAGNAP